MCYEHIMTKVGKLVLQEAFVEASKVVDKYIVTFIIYGLSEILW